MAGLPAATGGARALPRSAAINAAVGRDLKGKASIVLYVAAIPLAFVRQELADALFVTVALIWLVPDRRIERLFGTPATGVGA